MTGATGPDQQHAPEGARVLVVDDERPLAEVVATYLEHDGFEVTLAHHGREAVLVARDVDPDVVVLDLALPGMDGLQVCRELRRFSDCYVVMLTARVEEEDKLAGLAAGADDYVTKPFSPRELVARIEAMLRRPRRFVADPARGERPTTRRELGALVVDPATRVVTVDDREVSLTRIEFDVLDALSAQPGRVLGRRELIEEVWGESWVGDDRLVDVHIGHLRRKLRDPAGEPRFIRTVRGIGYRLDTDGS